MENFKKGDIIIYSSLDSTKTGVTEELFIIDMDPDPGDMLLLVKSIGFIQRVILLPMNSCKLVFPGI